jgi:hypothetical protein
MFGSCYWNSSSIRPRWSGKANKKSKFLFSNSPPRGATSQLAQQGYDCIGSRCVPLMLLSSHYRFRRSISYASHPRPVGLHPRPVDLLEASSIILGGRCITISSGTPILMTNSPVKNLIASSTRYSFPWSLHLNKRSEPRVQGGVLTLPLLLTSTRLLLIKTY